MRTEKSINNSIFAMINNITAMIIGLVSQKVFILILGTEYLGLNSLFSNILSMLAIVELGIGSAIIFNLYKPIKENDFKTINSLMKFYKKAYRIIAVIVFSIALIIIPFLKYFITDLTVNINIIIVYLLFVIDVVLGYFLSYKRSILYADQKNYIIHRAHIIITFIVNVLQILSLYLTKNYYLYLIVKIIINFLENLYISKYVNKKYSFIDMNNATKLDKEIENDIFKKVKALFFHKIASFMVLGTDNLIISRYLGIFSVGLYSNYYLLISCTNKLFNQGLVALTPSVGNLLVEQNTKKNYDVFDKIRFINYWISTFTGVSLLLLIEPFIKIWLGNDFILPTIVLIVLIVNYYQKMMRSSYVIFKEAAGIYYEDRFVPIAESFVNIVFSIILVKLIGLPGVFLGTVISGLCLWCYSYPKFVYKKLFNRLYKQYAFETVGYISLFFVISFLSFSISKLIVINNIIFSFLFNIVLAIIIPNLIIIIIFRKNKNYKYFINLLKEIFFKKILRRKK